MRRDAGAAIGGERIDHASRFADGSATGRRFGGASRLLGVVAIGALFFLVVAPLGMATRALGRDRLRLRRVAAASYWIVRDPPASAATGMTKQF